MYKKNTNELGVPRGYVHQILLIMRLTTIILIMAIMQVSASTFAQRITLSEKNAKLTQVFDRISDQCGYNFVFTSDLLKGTKPVTINVKNIELDKVLEQIFANQPVFFSIEDKTVVIMAKEKGFFENLIANFRSIDVRGKILDEKGQPLVGATVAIKGKNRSVKTDQSGAFYLENVGENDKLVISYIGYQNREVDVASDMGSLTMVLADAKLEEVMINAGYYTVKDSERTGSISRITSKDIEKQPVNNVLAVMQGRMAGVSVTQTTGTPGGGFEIKIRGQNSIRTEGNSPLYIIDGVPYASDPIGSYPTASFGFPTPTSPLNSINSNNIESIEILKDADATAIYGSRGSNGVVLISTKKGKTGKTKVDLNTFSGVGRVTRFLKLMNTQEYLAMRKQAFINDGIDQYEEWDYDINGTWDQNRYTDWQKELLGGSAETQSLQGTISGGNNNSQFLISGNYRSESTVLPGDFLYRKGGAHASFNHHSNDNKFKLDFSFGYDLQNNNQPSFDFTKVARSLPPNAPALYNADGSLNWENSTWQNPLSNLNTKFESKTNGLVANTVLAYEFLPGLIARSSFGLTDLSTIETRVEPSTIYDPAYNVSSSNSFIQFNNTDRSSWIIEPQINWNTQLGGGKIDVLLGATYQNQNTSKLYQSGIGFSSNSLIYNLAAANTIGIQLNEITQYKYLAFFGRLNYNYDQRYIVNLTARRDGSSRFGPGKQFANFGAVGAAWLFSNERFLKNNSWLNFGKLRVSYGITGSDQIGDYMFFNTYTTSGVAYNNNIGLEPTQLYNPNFAWETNRKLEAALELNFFKDRINLTGAWYKNRSSNQLVGIPFPGTSGFSSLQANLDATVQNTGLEFTLHTDNFKTKNLTWSTNFNLSFSKNKLIRFPGLAGSSYNQQYRIGEPLNIQLLYQYKGVNRQTGIYEFFDRNNDNKISSPDDEQSIADLSPQYFGGLQNQLSYKRFTLDFLVQFIKQKNNTYPMGPTGLMSNQQKRKTDSWLSPGSTAQYQINTTGYNSDALSADYLYSISTAAVTDASFIRLKNVSLSYDLPLKSRNMKCGLILQGQNLITFTKYEDGDPEFIAYGYLPPLKLFTAGINLTF